MPVKIRLKREGRKKRPFYHIVIADSRAPRDGRFIEKIGYYNPNTNPATIELEFDKTLDWLQKGAQPTDTCRAILSYKGVLYKNHLLKGVQKGAFSEEEAEKRFQAWMEDKEARIAAKADNIRKGKDEEKKKRLAEEAKINQARADELAKKQSQLAEEIAKAAAAESGESEDAEVLKPQDDVSAEAAPAEEVIADTGNETAETGTTLEAEETASEETAGAKETKETGEVSETESAATEVADKEIPEENADDASAKDA